MFQNPKKEKKITLNRFERYNSIRSDFRTYLQIHPEGHFLSLGD
jgi:hypothetical protein